MAENSLCRRTSETSASRLLRDHGVSRVRDTDPGVGPPCLSLFSPDDGWTWNGNPPSLSKHLVDGDSVLCCIHTEMDRRSEWSFPKAFSLLTPLPSHFRRYTTLVLGCLVALRVGPRHPLPRHDLGDDSPTTHPGLVAAYVSLSSIVETLVSR